MPLLFYTVTGHALRFGYTYARAYPATSLQASFGSHIPGVRFYNTLTYWLLAPVLFEAGELVGGDVRNGAVFLFAEVGALHGCALVVEVAYGGIVYKIGGFHKSEVHGIAAEVVKHHHVCVGAESAPAVWSLVTLTFTVLIMLVECVGAAKIGR